MLAMKAAVDRLPACSMFYHEAYHLLVFLGLHFTFISGNSIQKRDTGCPVFWDREWRLRDEGCPDGLKYHCFTNEDNERESEGCFEQKTCVKGAHPAAEKTYVVCRMCRSGFQNTSGIKSNEYTYSYCEPHSAPCNPEHGQVECRPPTAQEDRACSCSRSLGFIPRIPGEDCQCFTTNDPCSGCTFVGCLNGTVKNNRGFCEPAPNVTDATSVSTTWPPTTTSVPGEDGLPGGVVAVIVLVPLAVIAVVAFVLYKKREPIKTCLGLRQEDSYIAVGEAPSGTSQSEPPQPTTVKDAGDMFIRTDVANFYMNEPNGAQAPTVNIGKVKHLVMSAGENKGDSPAADIPEAAASHRGNAGETGQALPSECGDVPPEPGSPTVPSVAGTEQEPLPFPTEASEEPAPPPVEASEEPAPPPVSLALPSAPPLSLHTPSAPPRSLSTPSAPPLSLPEMDKAEPDESNEETERKVPFHHDDNTVPKTRLSDYDETSAKTVMGERVSRATEEADDRTDVKANSDETDPLLAGASVKRVN